MGKRERSRAKVYVALLIPGALTPIDFTMVNIILPGLVREVGASTSDLAWMVVIYALTYIAVMLIASNAGDRFGRRRVLVLGLAVFGVSAVLAALSNAAPELIICRGVMGIGAAMVTPMSLSLLQHSASTERELTRAIRLWGAVAAVSLAAGPIVGGLLLSVFSWRSVFWFDVPFTVISLVCALLWVDESRAPNPRQSDLLGSLLSAAGLFAAMWAIIEGPELGWLRPQTLLPLAVGLALLTGFVLWERVAPAPMVDFSLMADRSFSVPLVCILATNLPLTAALFMVTQYFEFAAGWGPLATGLGLAPLAAAMALTSWHGGRSEHRFGLRATVICGFSLQAAGYGIAALTTGHGSAWVLASALALCGLGLGFVYVPAVNAVIRATPPDRAGMGAGIQHLFRQASSALGVAVLGAVLTISFVSQLRSSVGGAADDVIVAAHDSVGAALVASAGNEGLTSIVQASFSHGFQVAVAACGAVSLVAIILARRKLAGRVPATEEGGRSGLTETTPPTPPTG